MAAKTATVYAGVQANGTADCAMVVNKLLAKGYDGQRYGHDGNLPTSSNFADGKNRTFMYWSSHGTSTYTNYRVQGSSWIDVKSAMSGWDDNDPCEVMMFASCYAFKKANFVRHFYDSMQDTNVFVICGYGGTAPAGTSTDVNIAEEFFDGLDDGLGVVYAWRAANQSYAKSSWGAMSYGTTSANTSFTLPGWGTNPGISRSQPIWCLKQDYAQPYTPSSVSEEIMSASLPYEISIAADPVEVNYGIFGNATVNSTNGIKAKYRNAGIAEMTTGEVMRQAADAMDALELDEIAQNSEMFFAPITVTEVNDEGFGTPFTIGNDIVFQQKHNGVEIENNFLRLCMDKDGVYRIVNKWKPVVAAQAGMMDSEMMNMITADEAVLKVDLADDLSIEESGYVYRPNANGTYRLFHKFQLSDGSRCYVDSRTGDKAIEA